MTLNIVFLWSSCVSTTIHNELTLPQRRSWIWKCARQFNVCFLSCNFYFSHFMLWNIVEMSNTLSTTQNHQLNNFVIELNKFCCIYLFYSYLTAALYNFFIVASLHSTFASIPLPLLNSSKLMVMMMTVILPQSGVLLTSVKLNLDFQHYHVGYLLLSP